MVVARAIRAATTARPSGGPAALARPLPRGRIRAGLRWGMAVAVFVGLFALRFLDVRFVNDHARVLSQGRQVLAYGEAPVRDFIDPGVFLQIYASAAVQLLFGYNLLGEALLSIVLLAWGAALTFWLATRASGSLLIGLVVTALASAAYPRLNAYPKILIPVLGLFVCWWYLDRRTTGRLIVVAVVTAIAFLYRHDHGIYLGLAAAVMLVAAHWRDGARLLLRRAATFAACVAVLLLPFFAFLAANGGVLEYFRSSGDYIRQEARRHGLLRRGLFRPPAFVIERSTPLIIAEPPAPAPAAPINVRWAEDVTPELRADLERRYHLAEPRLSEGDPRDRSWRYALQDLSEPNVAALVRDRHVEDTAGIDRASARVNPPPSEPFYAPWQRALGVASLRVAPGVIQPANARPWLYYLFLGLPVLATLALLLKRVRPRAVGERLPAEAPKILSAVVLCAVVQPALLREARGSTEVFGYAAAPTAVIAAWLLGQWLTGRRSRPTPTPTPLASRGGWAGLARIARAGAATGRVAVAVLLVGLTWHAITDAGWERRLDEAGLRSGPAAVLLRARTVMDELRASPPVDVWAPPGTVGRRALARYVHACTTDTDRLLVTSFEPDLYFYSGRGFAGGQLFWFDGYYSSSPEQQQTVERLRAQSVPIVIADADSYSRFAAAFGQVAEHIEQHYRLARESTFGDRDLYRVLVDARLEPSGAYEPLALPCYR